MIKPPWKLVTYQCSSCGKITVVVTKDSNRCPECGRFCKVVNESSVVR